MFFRVMKIEENGIQQRFYKKFYSEKPTCDNAGANFVIVGLNEVYFAFLVWIIGISISIGIYIIEIIFFKCYKTENMHSKN